MKVFPIGHYLGERHPDGVHLVRVGREQRALTPDEFGVWVLAHGTVEAGRDGWTTADLVALAARVDLPGAGDAVARLAAAGVLATPTSTTAFVRSYRVEPLLLGLGNSAAAPDRYELGIPGSPPVAAVGASSFELWQWAHLAPTLWHTCVVREQVSARLDAPVTAVEAIDDLLGDLRELLVAGAAYLDVPRSG